MMLKTSSNKLNPASKMLLHTVSKNKGLLILLSAGMLIYCPGFVLMRITEDLEHSAYGLDFPDYIYTFALTVSVLAGICVVLFNLINFMYLYSKKSSDVFHSLPLTRTELFFSRGFAGFLLTLIPVLLGYISLICIALFIPRASGAEFIPVILICLAYTVITMLVCASFSAVFAICAGTAFDFMLSFLGFNAGMLLCGVIMASIFDNLLLGYNNENISDIFKIVSPPFYCIQGLTDYMRYEPKFTFSDAMFFVRTGIYVIVFSVMSVLLYNRRKAEKGGEAYAYRFIYILCALIAGFCGAYVIGIILSNEEHNAVFWLFAVLGGVGTTVAYGAISDRGFKTFKRSILLGLGSVAIMGVITIIVSAGGFGFTDRIPQKDKVSSVTVRYSNEDLKFDDASLPIEIHQAIIQNKDAVSQKHSHTENPSTYIYFDYELENGSFLSRAFLIDREAFAEKLLKLHKSDERIKAIIDSFAENGVTTAQVYITKPHAKNHEDYINTYITANEFSLLMQAYKKDVKNASKEVITNEESQLICSVSWNNHYYYNYDLQLEDSFEETLAVLESFNLEQRAAKQETTESYTYIYSD